MDYRPWVQHFEGNRARHALHRERLANRAGCSLPADARTAFIHSFQRFALGEDGAGERLLVKVPCDGSARRTALELFVAEEQAHAELFRTLIEYLDGSELRSHWSDSAFTALRRALSFRTELALFLIAEAVAMGYFQLLAEHAGDPVIREAGVRLADDERAHIELQVEQLSAELATQPAVLRLLIGAAWAAVAAGAAGVLAIDHARAIRACGADPGRYWIQAMNGFGQVARRVLGDPTLP